MAQISTHVLDVAKGAPAAGIPIDLFLDGERLASTITNLDGRTDEPLVSTESIAIGEYDLVFRVANYLRSHHPDKQPFYDRIEIRFAVNEADGHYHVPLLLAPHAYSTYRGS